MPKNKKPTRCFTHADIVKFYEGHWGKGQNPVFTLEEIELLPQIAPPTWRILHRATYSVGDRTYESSHTLIVVQCLFESGIPYLNPVQAEALPEGCSSVQEEDEKIRHRRLAQEAVWFAKWKEERKEGNGNHGIPESL